MTKRMSVIDVMNLTKMLFANHLDSRVSTPTVTHDAGRHALLSGAWIIDVISTNRRQVNKSINLQYKCFGT